MLEYPYFEQKEPTVWDEGGTYVETDHVFTHNVTHEWNHGIGETVQAVIDAGLRITALREHTELEWVEYERAYDLLRWESDKVAIWELHERLSRGIMPKSE